MDSEEYRSIIARIVRNSLKKEYPQLKLKSIDSREGICYAIARAIHARMYGANVDGVDSPIWHNTMNHDRPEPKIDASELLKEDEK